MYVKLAWGFVSLFVLEKYSYLYRWPQTLFRIVLTVIIALSRGMSAKNTIFLGPVTAFFRSMAQRSLSEQWRTEGNTIYVTAKIDLSPTVREARLQKAMSCFEKAQQTASSDDETASASKNIGMCSWRLATVSYTMGKIVLLCIWKFSRDFYFRE